ncbi:hypothetical protein J2Q11_11825 [Tenacibaculum finnmarkense genomovar finnmarkense]|uniref:helix-turn-helix domain-containing protein n=1 Tax=Tenacibaculum finnmarkense TaxID=2781243 RepID=UPI001EFA3B92|nr:helix-turn-helix domain-containing protein [Tenacibaculum finnmarkense]MCG8186695.1 hypothetical protein [Tenacibaculum finnmarkense genomovar finnmarkense]MCG8210602.1 hypothetical protein [Tenacibaculum finnmarkense genomovar finnmarkense]MCG8213505.1 hypothetical protein [Tenacibaculum finnmarkense genomovar finnmarkense]MCG8226314.1 hypothetical protein [Tenacibaculum finnmarkense genomovar finnmarkense]MCG8231818.1 hypothetical protein [Tenacibaculum finnmarkense genomovar finnmarkense
MAKRTNNEPIRAIAQRMFVEEGLNAKAIAIALDKTEQTIGRWRKGFGDNPINWDEERKQFLATPHNIRKLIAKELSQLVEGKKAELDMKAIQAAIKALQNMADETSVEVVYTVFKEFDNWMAEQEPEIAISFLEWHKNYLLHKAQQTS